MKPKLEVSIKIRSALVEKEYISATKKKIKLIKVFPPYKGDKIDITIERNKSCNVSEYNKDTEAINDIYDSEEVIQKNINNNLHMSMVNETYQHKNILNSSMLNFSNMSNFQTDFKQEELKDPDILENLNSLKVLNYKIAKYESKAANYGGQIPLLIKNKISKCKVKLKVIFIFKSYY